MDRCLFRDRCGAALTGTRRCRRQAVRPLRGARILAILCIRCASISRRCTGSATTSSSSMRPADESAPRSPSALRALADRRTGIGFDQALVLGGAARRRHGGLLPGLQCRRRRGRAVRQRRALHRRAPASPRTRAAQRRRRPRQSRPALVRARASPRTRASRSTWACRTSIRARYPSRRRREADPYPLRSPGRTLAIGAVSIGNPHAVLTVASTSTQRPGRHARSCDRAPSALPAARERRLPRDRRRARRSRLRVYERGAGETLAAAAPAPARRSPSGGAAGSWTGAVRVAMRGGELRVNWAGPGSSIWLTGPTRDILRRSRRGLAAL